MTNRPMFFLTANKGKGQLWLLDIGTLRNHRASSACESSRWQVFQRRKQRHFAFEPFFNRHDLKFWNVAVNNIGKPDSGRLALHFPSRLAKTDEKAQLGILALKHARKISHHGGANLISAFHRGHTSRPA